MVQRTVCSVVIARSNYLSFDRRLKTALSVRCQFLLQWDSGSLKQSLIYLLFTWPRFHLMLCLSSRFYSCTPGLGPVIHKVVVFVCHPSRTGFQVLLSSHKRKSYFYIILFRDLSIFLTPSSSSRRGKRQRDSFLPKEY